MSLQKRLGSPNLLPMSSKGQKKLGLSMAQESYVECIADAEAHHGHAHVSLLAGELGITKPSVIQMTARLVAQGIAKRNDKEITLTSQGRRIAGELHGRHALLQEFMIEQLGMEAKAANTEACRLEHAVSPAFVRGLRAFLGTTEGSRRE